MSYDFIIIGGGPSGCAAAIFAAKTKRKAVIIHKGTTPLIHTFQWLLPGFPENMGAADWANSLRTQVQHFDIPIIEEEVTQAALGASTKQIITSSGKTLEAPIIILATGCYDRQSFIDGEARFAGHGVFYNAFQDAYLCNDATVAVEAKNDDSVREVLYLSRFAKKIYLIAPAMKLEIEDRLAQHVKNNEKIELLLSSSIKTIQGNTKLESVNVLAAGQERVIPVDAVFLYARKSKAKYDFLKGTIEISEDGCVLVDEKFMTSIPGVFACGGMLSGTPQLPFVSAAQGMLTSMNADQFLFQNQLA